MKLQLFTTILVLAKLTLSGCGSHPSELNENTSQELPQLHRSQIVSVNFTKWNDYVTLEGVFYPPKQGEQKCMIAKPVTDHETVRWAPFQTFWVHMDPHNDMVDSFDKIYSSRDKVSKADFEGAKGIRPLTSLNRKFFSIKNLNVSADKKTAIATLSIPMLTTTYEATIKISAKYIKDTCQADVREITSGKPVSKVNIGQNALGLVKDVQLR